MRDSTDASTRRQIQSGWPAAFEHVPVPILYVDLDRALRVPNRALRELDLFDPTLQDAATTARLADLGAGREDVLSEVRQLRRADQTALSARITVAATGEPRAFVLTIEAEEPPSPTPLDRRILFDEAPIAYQVFEFDGLIRECNQAFSALTGYVAGDRPHAPDDPALVEGLARLRAGEIEVFEYVADQAHLADGRLLPARLLARLLRDGNGEPDCVLAWVFDVTTEARARQSVSAQERQMRRLAEILPVGVAQFDSERRAIFWNQRLETMLGDPSGPDRIARIHPDSHDLVRRTFTELLQKDGEREHIHRALIDGEWRWVHVRVASHLDEDGSRSAVMTVQDVDATFRMRERADELALIVELTGDLVAVLDVESFDVIYANQAVRIRYSIPEGSLPRKAEPFFGPGALETMRAEMWPALARDGQWEGTLPARSLAGTEFEVAWTVTMETRPDGQRRLLTVGRDVTDERRAVAELNRRARHDELTGLLNRSALVEVVSRLGHADRKGATLLFLDVDRFKEINDRWGHDVGDEIIRRAGARLRDAVGADHHVARLGGDEFVVVCGGLTERSEAVQIAETISDAFERRPFDVGGVAHRITTSIGVAVTSGPDTESLLREADAAMYRAKERGRGGIELYDDDLAAQRDERRKMATALHRAIEAGEIEVVFQPIMTPARTIVAVEALARWRFNGFPVSPPTFVAIAEEQGLIHQLGRSVLDQALHEAAQWPAPAPAVSVNISALQLGPRLVADTARQLLDHGLAPDRLWLELTETAAMQDVDRSLSVLQRLAGLGVVVVIDDFGAGYSSLSHLRQLPAGIVKIDRSFIEGVDHDPSIRAVIGAIGQLAKALGLRTVAEGVETAEQLTAVASLGCELLQGYHLGRPMRSEELRALLG